MKWPVHISQHRSHIWWGVTFKFTTQTLVRGFTCSGKCRSLKECVLHSHWEDKRFKTPAAFEGLWDPSLLAGDAAHITEIIIVVQLWQPKPQCPVLAPQGGDWTLLEQNQERLGQPGEGSGLGKNSICKNPQLEMETCARPSLFVPREHIRATGTNQSTTNSIPSNIRKPPAFLCLTIKFYSLFFFSDFENLAVSCTL